MGGATFIYRVLAVFNYNYDRKELPQSQILGMLTIICKKHDPLSLSNYRLITLLITDTKLIAYAYLLTLPLFAGVILHWRTLLYLIFPPRSNFLPFLIFVLSIYVFTSSILGCVDLYRFS
jgi:hypothetical protein